MSYAFPSASSASSSPHLQRCPTCLNLVPLWETLSHVAHHHSLAHSLSPSPIDARSYGLSPADGFSKGSAPGLESLFGEARIPPLDIRQPDWSYDNPISPRRAERREVIYRKVTPDGQGGYYEDEIEQHTGHYDNVTTAPSPLLDTPASLWSPPAYQPLMPSGAIAIPGAVPTVDPMALLGMVEGMSMRQQQVLQGFPLAYGR